MRPDLVILNFEPILGGVGWGFLQLLTMNDTTADISILVIVTPFHLSAEIQAYPFTRYINVVHQPFEVESFLNLVRMVLIQASQSSMILSDDRTLSVLVVDDEELSDNFVTVLQLENYRMVTAHTGQVGLEYRMQV